MGHSELGAGPQAIPVHVYISPSHDLRARFVGFGTMSPARKPSECRRKKRPIIAFNPF